MNNENARLIARNIYAKHSGCTRREAERVLTKVSDEDCLALVAMTPDAAAAAVKEAVVHAAERIVSNAAKEPSAEATVGLSDAAEAVIDGPIDAPGYIERGPGVNEEEIIDGEEETGLDPG